MNTGALAPRGSETVVNVKEDGVRSFTVQITEYEGDVPGLTEIEAYSGDFDTGVSFVKLMNGDGDFVYDYYIEPSGSERFSLYAYGCSAEPDEYEIRCAGDDGCRAYADGESIVVECPTGKSCEVTVTDGVNADTAVFRNSGSDELPYGAKTEKILREKWLKVCQLMEMMRNIRVYSERFVEINTAKLMNKLAYLKWGIHRVGEIVSGA